MYRFLHIEKVYKLTAFDRPQAITTVKQENFAKAKESILSCSCSVYCFKLRSNPISRDTKGATEKCP